MKQLVIRNKKKEKSLNKITNKDVWKQYKEECKENKELEHTIQTLRIINLDNDKIKNVEENWNEFKNVLKSLENWVRMKDKDLGQKHYSFINQMIKTSEEINISQMIKRTAWKKYKKSKGTYR